MKQFTPMHARATRRNFIMACCLVIMGASPGASRYALAQAAPTSAGPADTRLIEDLVAANRILVDKGPVLDHSKRSDER